MTLDRWLSICAIAISLGSFVVAIRSCSLSTSVNEPEIKVLVDGQFLTDKELQETKLPPLEDELRAYAKNSHSVSGRHLLLLATVENTDAKFPIDNIELEFEFRVTSGAEVEKTLAQGVNRKVDYIKAGASGTAFLAHFDIGNHQSAYVRITTFRASWKGGTVTRACGYPQTGIFPGEDGLIWRGGCVEEPWF